jgi:4,5-dihydroxyphthalate decarboxylase
MAAPSSLNLGLSRSPITIALHEGDVKSKGIDVNFESEFSEGLDNTGARHRQILAGELDGGECSTSSFLLARTRGVDLVAIPVFPARSFPHRQIYCNTKAPIKHPSDLEGKRVTVHRWNSTSPTWTKGLLENEYDVTLRSISWFTAEPDPPGEGAPPDFKIQRVPEPASREKAIEMLENGELDAGLDPYIHPSANVRRVLDDWRKEASGFFQRQQIFPMSHTVVLKGEIARENPWIVESLIEAFSQSRQQASKYQDDEAKDHERWLWETLGSDPHVYRLGPVEKKTLNELVRYQFQQGLRTEPIDPIAQFATEGI